MEEPTICLSVATCQTDHEKGGEYQCPNECVWLLARLSGSFCGKPTCRNFHNINKIQNYNLQQDKSIMTIHTTQAFRSYKYFSTKFAIENCHPYPTLFTNTPHNYTPRLKHKRKQLGLHIQATQHINRHIQIQLLPSNN